MHCLCAVQSNIKNAEDTRKGNILDLFRTPNMCRKTLCMFFIWVVCGLGFYGLAQYMGQIGGNIFINVAISGQFYSSRGGFNGRGENRIRSSRDRHRTEIESSDLSKCFYKLTKN
jgi:hypothetical protein